MLKEEREKPNVNNISGTGKTDGIVQCTSNVPDVDEQHLLRLHR
jgi:hypothetical protein